MNELGSYEELNVDLDAPELHNGFAPLHDPSHPDVVISHTDEELDVLWPPSPSALLFCGVARPLASASPSVIPGGVHRLQLPCSASDRTPHWSLSLLLEQYPQRWRQAAGNRVIKSVEEQAEDWVGMLERVVKESAKKKKRGWR